MSNSNIEQLLWNVLSLPLRKSIDAFILDRRAQHLSPRTIQIYSYELGLMCDFLEKEGVETLAGLNAHHLRLYTVHLEGRRNPGGQHIAHRTMKTFTYWVEEEVDGAWRSPMRKIKPPKLGLDALDPITSDTLKALNDTCPPNNFYGDRDRAIFHFLADTGLRVSEFLALDLQDIDIVTGDVWVRRGKGHKPRSVYFGKKTKKVLRIYLRHRTDTGSALWIKDDGERMTYESIRDMFNHRATQAGVDEPSPHDFRRYFALTLHRQGVSLETIRKLMGHRDLQILQRYIKQSPQDVRDSLGGASPMDTL